MTHDFEGALEIGSKLDAIIAALSDIDIPINENNQPKTLGYSTHELVTIFIAALYMKSAHKEIKIALRLAQRLKSGKMSRNMVCEIMKSVEKNNACAIKMYQAMAAQLIKEVSDGR